MHFGDFYYIFEATDFLRLIFLVKKISKSHATAPKPALPIPSYPLASRGLYGGKEGRSSLTFVSA